MGKVRRDSSDKTGMSVLANYSRLLLPSMEKITFVGSTLTEFAFLSSLPQGGPARLYTLLPH